MYLKVCKNCLLVFERKNIFTHSIVSNNSGKTVLMLLIDC